MKRLFSCFFSVLLCFSAVAGLAGCRGGDGGGAHEHSYQTVWTYDAEAHWHACAAGTCPAIIDRSAHTWDDGVVEDDGMVYRCTLCAYQRKTDDLSGSVTETEWKGILLPEHFKNVTLTVTEELTQAIDGYVSILMTARVTEDGIHETFRYYDEADALVKTFEKYAQDVEGKLALSASVDGGELKELEDTPDMTYEAYYTDYMAGLPRHIVDLSDSYGLFTYDAAAGCYVSEEISQTVELDGGAAETVYYDLFRVWFEDGHLSRIEFTSEEMTAVLTYTDYGTTTIG